MGSELRDYRVEVEPNSFTADSQRHKSACGVRPGPRSVSGVGDVVGGQTEIEQVASWIFVFVLK